jgi:hypothetical protein
MNTALVDMPDVLGPRLDRHLEYITCVLKAVREASAVGERGGGEAFKHAFVQSVEYQMQLQVGHSIIHAASTSNTTSTSTTTTISHF